MTRRPVADDLSAVDTPGGAGGSERVEGARVVRNGRRDASAGSDFRGRVRCARARVADEAAWRRGDDVTGDPPQEPRHRNSVCSSDPSTVATLERHTAETPRQSCSMSARLRSMSASRWRTQSAVRRGSGGVCRQ